MMARSHARILVTIWADPDWRGLPRDCQWFYELLLSQPHMTHCGVLQIPRRGWETCSDDDDNREAITRAMKTLGERQYIVVDEDTDEILVRSFMRHDGVIDGPPGTLKNALIAARAVASRRIRTALYVELAGVDQAVIAAKKVREGHEHPVETLRQTLLTLQPGPGGGHPRRSGYGIGDAIAVRSSDGMGDTTDSPPASTPPDAIGNAIGNAMSYASGVGEGVGVSSSPPVGLNSALQTKNTRAPRSTREPTPPGFDEFWSAYPRKEGKRKAQQAYTAALKRGAEPAELLSAARHYRTLTANTEPRFIAHPATWLNQGRYDDEPATQAYLPVAVGSTPRQGTTTQRVNAILALKRGDPR